MAPIYIPKNGPLVWTPSQNLNRHTMYQKGACRTNPPRQSQRPRGELSDPGFLGHRALTWMLVGLSKLAMRAMGLSIGAISRSPYSESPNPNMRTSPKARAPRPGPEERQAKHHCLSARDRLYPAHGVQAPSIHGFWLQKPYL